MRQIAIVLTLAIIAGGAAFGLSGGKQRAGYLSNADPSAFHADKVTTHGSDAQ